MTGLFKLGPKDSDLFGMPQPLSSTRRPQLIQNNRYATTANIIRPNSNYNPAHSQQSPSRNRIVTNSQFSNGQILRTSAKRPSFVGWQPPSHIKKHVASSFKRNFMSFPNETMAKAAILAVMLRPGDNLLQNVHSTMSQIDASSRSRSIPPVSGQRAQITINQDRTTDQMRPSLMQNQRSILPHRNFSLSPLRPPQIMKAESSIPLLRSAPILQRTKIGDLQV